MTITLTTDELSTLCAKMQVWYDGRSLHVLKNLRVDLIRTSNTEEQLMRLIKEYEDKNPRPDWKSYL